MHTFVLKWPSADANLQTIDVLVSSSGTLLQTIQVPQDQVKLLWQDIDQSKGTIKDKILESEDYNFDRFADLRLTEAWPYKVGEKKYLIWLFDETLNQYVLSKPLSALGAPQPEPKARHLKTIELGAFGGGEYVERIYSVDTAGNPTVVARITQKVLSRERLSFTREVRTRVGKYLQRACRIFVPAEGVPVITWGRKRTCAPYLIKDIPDR